MKALRMPHRDKILTRKRLENFQKIKSKSLKFPLPLSIGSGDDFIAKNDEILHRFAEAFVRGKFGPRIFGSDGRR